jgi:hypothetical protein
MQPLEVTHPKFEELKKDFINLNSIQLKFKQGLYTSTFALGLDIRKMWTTAFKLFADDPDKYSQTQQIQQYFEQIFVDIDNKSLVPQAVPPVTSGYQLQQTDAVGQQSRMTG